VYEEAKNKMKKPPVYEGVLAYFPLALIEVAKVSAYGLEKHNLKFPDRGFMKEEYPLCGFDNALVRHLLALQIKGEYNVEDGGVLHRAQIAWNALAALEKELEAELTKPDPPEDNSN